MKLELMGFRTTGNYVQLNSMENRVFLFTCESIGLPNNFFHYYPDEISEKFVIKFYRKGRWNDKQIQEEHNFLYELEKSEIPVITPIRSSSGESIFEMMNYKFSIWPNQRGRLVEELDSMEYLRLGRLLGRIHNLGAMANFKYRMNLNGIDFGKRSLSFLVNNYFSNQSLMNRYNKIVINIITQYDELLKKIPLIRIHGDCHKGNLIQLGEKFCFIDFDDTLNGPPVQDFWMLLPSDILNNQILLDYFLEGYREFRDFKYEWLDLILPLRALRYVYYSAWVGTRYNEELFQNLIPHFGTEEYWEEEIRDLEDLVKGNSIFNSEIPQKPNEEIYTNKDYFWDMD